MGTYAECWLGNLHFGSSKNDVDPQILALFQDIDRRVISDAAAVTHQVLREVAAETDFDEGQKLVFYVAPGNVIRDRLELMGYTLETCKAVFNDCVQVELERVEGIL